MNRLWSVCALLALCLLPGRAGAELILDPSHPDLAPAIHEPFSPSHGPNNAASITFTREGVTFTFTTTNPAGFYSCEASGACRLLSPTPLTPPQQDPILLSMSPPVAVIAWRPVAGATRERGARLRLQRSGHHRGRPGRGVRPPGDGALRAPGRPFTGTVRLHHRPLHHTQRGTVSFSNHAPDARVLGDKAKVRAERTGDGDGRVYHLAFTARDGTGASCSGVVTTCVPHSGPQGSCVDQGPRFDSTRR